MSTFDQRLVDKINRYWAERGYEARARIEVRKWRSWRDRYGWRLSKPVYVNRPSIASDIDPHWSPEPRASLPVAGTVPAVALASAGASLGEGI